MNPNQPTKLAIFDKGFFEVINSQDEFTLWKELQEIFFGKKYKEATIEEIKQEYFELIGRDIRRYPTEILSGKIRKFL